MMVIVVLVGVCLLILLGMQYANAASWTLDVKLINPPFGVKDVKVTVVGPFSYQVSKTINWQQQVNLHPAQPGIVHVYFPIPSNVIPLHYKYEVYAYNLANILQALVPHYAYIYHNYEPNEQLTMSVIGPAKPLFP